ncbi:hypothetical protein NPIL_499481 [Nephila pilipes]|uniref:Uncharacterized protein n=1 Tax=Nephila pilipes TaxID=299642 RepID=A0A8X6TJ71_NEPPI|nr:hypothetical protein NPIL_499481 [Nephila pilipes]
MNSAPPPSSGCESETDLSLLKQISCLHQWKLRKIKRVKLRITTTLPSPRKKKKVAPIILDESVNTPNLLKELSEKTGSMVLGRFINGKLKALLATPNEHRIIQNYISVKKLKSHTYEMQHQKMLKVVVRGLPSDYDIKELIN